MKSPKSGAFANSATGYGKKSYSSNNAQKHSAKCPKATESKINKKEEIKPVNAEDTDNDLNSGFGTYLRSSEGRLITNYFDKRAIHEI